MKQQKCWIVQSPTGMLILTTASVTREGAMLARTEGWLETDARSDWKCWESRGYKVVHVNLEVIQRKQADRS